MSLLHVFPNINASVQRHQGPAIDRAGEKMKREREKAKWVARIVSSHGAKRYI